MISAAATTGATAADPILPAMVVVEEIAAPSFSWDRYYVGAYGGWWDCCGGMAGVNAGKNFQLGDYFVVGIDLMAGVYDFGSIDWETYALARAGVLLGGRVLLFGALGIGWDGPVVPAAAVGVEIGLSSALSLRGQVLLYDAFNSPDSAGVFGFAWHFGGP